MEHDSSTNSPYDEARATLLKALEELEIANSELPGAPQRVDLMVVYSIGCREESGWREIEGYVNTPGPMWMHATLLQRAADAFDENVALIDERFGDEDDDE